MAIEEGKPAPDFELLANDGETVSLAALRGRHVVLYFYPRDDTPGCTKEACGFRDDFAGFESLNAVVLGVSPDSESSHRKFADKYDLPFPLLCDPDHKVMEAYGAWGEKNMYGKKSMGVIRSTVWIDDQGVVRKHWKRVTKAETHPSKVRELLEAELGG